VDSMMPFVATHRTQIALVVSYVTFVLVKVLS
jgi:hypothetical protein